jgi:hypothetical protein
MVQKAEKHLQLATLYETLSANESASLGTRIAFARKANWHRILARMSAEMEQPVEKVVTDGRRPDLRSEPTLFSPSRLWDARDKDSLAVAETKAFRRAK